LDKNQLFLDDLKSSGSSVVVGDDTRIYISRVNEAVGRDAINLIGAVESK
jgi:hypothetical protein